MQNSKLLLKIKKTFHFSLRPEFTQKVHSKELRAKALFTFNFWPKQKGFTLIELLVVITLVGLIGTIVSQVFILGLRSQAKSEIIKEVKQNGDYALSVIDEMVRNATDITLSCNTDAKELSITSPDGETTTFDCGTDNKIASKSGTDDPVIHILTSDKVSVSSCNFRIVCPTPPLSPKYVFVNFTLIQGVLADQPTPLAENRASMEYQTTISLRNYK